MSIRSVMDLRSFHVIVCHMPYGIIVIYLVKPRLLHISVVNGAKGEEMLEGHRQSSGLGLRITHDAQISTERT